MPKGAHGYLVEDSPEMKTVFMAWGKNIRKGKRIAEFENIHIFPLLSHLLDLEYDHRIDGDNRLVELVVEE